MGRPLGSRNKPKDGEAYMHAGTEPGIGDNSTLEQKRSLLMGACDRIGQMKDEIASITGTMRQVYKEFKADGLQKKDIDLALSFYKMDGDEAVAWASSRAQIMEWVHPGVQAEFSFERAAE